MALSSLRLHRTLSSLSTLHTVLPLLYSRPTPPILSTQSWTLIQSRPFGSLSGSKGGITSSGSLSWISRMTPSLGLRWLLELYVETCAKCFSLVICLVDENIWGKESILNRNISRNLALKRLYIWILVCLGCLSLSKKIYGIKKKKKSMVSIYQYCSYSTS